MPNIPYVDWEISLLKNFLLTTLLTKIKHSKYFVCVHSIVVVRFQLKIAVLITLWNQEYIREREE